MEETALGLTLAQWHWFLSCAIFGALMGHIFASHR